MRIVYVVGARPNLVKMAPVIAALRKGSPDGRHVLVHTGQHYDRMMSEVFVEELGLPEPPTSSVSARAAMRSRQRERWSASSRCSRKSGRTS